MSDLHGQNAMHGITKLPKPVAVIGVGQGVCDVDETEGEVVAIEDDQETSILSFKQFQKLLRYRGKKAARRNGNGTMTAKVIE